MARQCWVAKAIHSSQVAKRHQIGLENLQDDAKSDHKTSSNGKPYFNLNAGKGQAISSSEMYISEASRDNGIDSVNWLK